jgi:hypothetical protein
VNLWCFPSSEIYATDNQCVCGSNQLKALTISWASKCKMFYCRKARERLVGNDRDAGT